MLLSLKFPINSRIRCLELKIPEKLQHICYGITPAVNLPYIRSGNQITKDIEKTTIINPLGLE